MKKVLQFGYFFLFASLLCSVTAFAYIDPSAMTYMIQLIAGIAIAAGAGASYYFRRLRRGVSRLGRKKDRAPQSFEAEDDDDDTGFGDYELETVPAAEKTFAAQPDQERSYASYSPAQEPSFPAEPIAAADPFDESGGTGGLAAENRELRRQLAEERRKVEELKRALHICTAPQRR